MAEFTDINLMTLNKTDLQVKAKEMQASIVNLINEEKKKELCHFETRLQLMEIKFEQACNEIETLKK